jgi:polysaccharide export outer membrane protein
MKSKLPILRLAKIAFSLFLALICFKHASAQQSLRPTSSPAPTVAETSSEDGHYRIGPGDVLEIKIAKAPELSLESVRVNHQGLIRMPMIDDEIKAACLTETELANKIRELYLEYKRNPAVGVFVKEFRSQPVAVIGQVNNFHPEGTQFQLRRRVRLLELLTLAGGPSERAGLTVNVIHSSEPTLCGEARPVQGDLGLLVTYQLRDTMRGALEANPILQSGDVVVVPEGEQVYVVGNVIKPSTIPLKEPLTVSRAVAIAGGTAPSTKRDRVRVIRQLGGNVGKQEIIVDLNAVEKKQAADLVLMPNDIVDVPISGTKSFLRSLMGAVAPAVSQMPVRVIP